MKTWVVHLIAYLLTLILGGVIGYFIFKGTIKKCPDIEKLKEELVVVRDSLNNLSYIIELEKVKYSKHINQLDSLNKIQYEEYQKELSNFNDVNIISDDSITNFISSYIHH